MDSLLPEQRRHIAEKDRRVVGETFINGIADVWADEESIVSEVFETFARSVRRRTECQNVDNLNVVHLSAPSSQCFDQCLWRRAAGADEDAHSVAQMFQRFLSGDEVYVLHESYSFGNASV